LDNRATQDYHISVTPSDEAFVWQVMTYYYPSWEEEERDREGGQGNDSTDGSSSIEKKNGPRKGFKQTASKTIHKYKEYICKMGRSRSGPNANMWSDNLKRAAQEIKREKEKVTREIEELDIGETELEETADLFEDFLQYTRFDFCVEEGMDGIDDAVPVEV
jgi:hypothetical protein